MTFKAFIPITIYSKSPPCWNLLFSKIIRALRLWQILHASPQMYEIYSMVNHDGLKPGILLFLFSRRTDKIRAWLSVVLGADGLSNPGNQRFWKAKIYHLLLSISNLKVARMWFWWWAWGVVIFTPDGSNTNKKEIFIIYLWFSWALVSPFSLCVMAWGKINWFLFIPWSLAGPILI